MAAGASALSGCTRDEMGGGSFDPSSFVGFWVAGGIFVAGAAVIHIGTRLWLGRVESHLLLRSDEKLQNKDALVIASFFATILLLGLCVTGAAAVAAHPSHAMAATSLVLVWALGATAVGATFGFLLGHPRRLGDEKPERSSSNWLLRTGLDDIVDWLVKGITTVLLVNSKEILAQLDPMAVSLTADLLHLPVNEVPGHPIALAQGVIIFFTVFGALAGCLITRTYLTGALTRADRSTTGAFTRAGLDWGEVLMLLSAQRSLGSRGGNMTPESKRVADKLAALSLEDLRAPQEFALWAKAKSMSNVKTDLVLALRGYEKALFMCDCDPALLLDFSVALHLADEKELALARLEQAYLGISAATPEETVKNIYKSYTYQLLYQPQSFDQVLRLANEYLKRYCLPSGGLRVNEACAWGQRFLWLAVQRGFVKLGLDGKLERPLSLTVPREQWEKDEELKQAYDGAYAAAWAAIEIDGLWIHKLRELLKYVKRTDAAGNEEGGEDDLQVFEQDPDFRELLYLPPVAKSTAMDGTEAAAGGGDVQTRTSDRKSPAESVETQGGSSTTNQPKPEDPPSGAKTP